MFINDSRGTCGERIAERRTRNWISMRAATRNLGKRPKKSIYHIDVNTNFNICLGNEKQTKTLTMDTVKSTENFKLYANYSLSVGVNSREAAAEKGKDELPKKTKRIMNHSRCGFCSFSIYICPILDCARLVRKLFNLRPKKSVTSLVIVFGDSSRDNFQWERRLLSFIVSRAGR